VNYKISDSEMGRMLRELTEVAVIAAEWKAKAEALEKENAFLHELVLRKEPTHD
jgi:hypothetical protein